MSQNFSVIGLRYHIAVLNPAGTGLLDSLQEIVAVQSNTKTQTLPVCQQAMVGGDLSVQPDLDFQQGLVLLGLALCLFPGLGQL